MFHVKQSSKSAKSPLSGAKTDKASAAPIQSHFANVSRETIEKCEKTPSKGAKTAQKRLKMAKTC